MFLRLSPFFLILVLLLILDAGWLYLRRDYHEKLFFAVQGQPMKLRIGAVAAVYAIIAVAIWYFVFAASAAPDKTEDGPFSLRRREDKMTVMGPAFVSGAIPTAFLQGSLLGASMYGVYDFTNYATLKNYSLEMTLADWAWGTFACGFAAAGTAWFYKS